jgi:hypothetical protein
MKIIIFLFPFLVYVKAMSLKGSENLPNETSSMPIVTETSPEPSLPSLPVAYIDAERPRIFLGATDAPYSSGYITNYHITPPGSN